MLDHVVFALRESPDWAALASDYAAGQPIAPERYASPRDIPSFPADIAGLIARWNAFSPVNFFECRRQLKEIAGRLLGRVEHAIATSHTALPEVLAGLTGQHFLVMFCDDDDWFAPDLFAIVSGLDLREADVAVFPLVRLEVNSFTLVRKDHAAHVAVGPCYPFVLRYHTNNYALAPRACRIGELAMLREHRTASQTADRLGFVDRYVDAIISATNKTPCSASLLAAVVADEAGFRGYVQSYIRQLKQLVIPAELGWMSQPLCDTIGAFEAVLAGDPAPQGPSAPESA
jgi:hypothetical protein